MNVYRNSTMAKALQTYVQGDLREHLQVTMNTERKINAEIHTVAIKLRTRQVRQIT